MGPDLLDSARNARLLLELLDLASVGPGPAPNPYRPGFNQAPLLLAGRDDVLDGAVDALEQAARRPHPPAAGGGRLGGASARPWCSRWWPTWRPSASGGSRCTSRSGPTSRSPTCSPDVCSRPPRCSPTPRTGRGSRSTRPRCAPGSRVGAELTMRRRAPEPVRHASLGDALHRAVDAALAREARGWSSPSTRCSWPRTESWPASRPPSRSARPTTGRSSSRSWACHRCAAPAARSPTSSGRPGTRSASSTSATRPAPWPSRRPRPGGPSPPPRSTCSRRRRAAIPSPSRSSGTTPGGSRSAPPRSPSTTPGPRCPCPRRPGRGPLPGPLGRRVAVPAGVPRGGRRPVGPHRRGDGR